jgi:succinate dehydrogenase / fumarate reductase cytochrome b subunit
MMNKRNSLQLSGNAILGAKQAGVDAMVTPCPLCHLNLDAYQPEIESRVGTKLGIPILHIPQLVAMALGVSQTDLRMNTHIVRPTGALASA